MWCMKVYIFEILPSLSFLSLVRHNNYVTIYRGNVIIWFSNRSSPFLFSRIWFYWIFPSCQKILKFIKSWLGGSCFDSLIFLFEFITLEKAVPRTVEPYTRSQILTITCPRRGCVAECSLIKFPTFFGSG